MHHVTILAFALSLLSSAALAQVATSKTFYGSLGYGQMDTGRYDLGAVTGRLGAQFTPYLGVEGEASLGVKGDEAQVSVGGDVRFKLDHDAALYGVGRLPLGDHVSLLARIGYGTTRIKATGTSTNTHRDEQSLNYGLGAQFDFDDSNGLRADWTRRAFDGADADVYALSYVRRF
jgi:hypothetical protein